jgi:hypothetical protein
MVTRTLRPTLARRMSLMRYSTRRLLFPALFTLALVTQASAVAPTISANPATAAIAAPVMAAPALTTMASVQTSTAAVITVATPAPTITLVAQPVLAPKATIELPAASTAFKKDLYFAAGYEHQVDNRTCSAASTAMMMNFIARRDLHLRQMTILRYEQPRDALNDAKQRGSDPLGWSRAATYFSKYTGKPTTYKWEAYGSELSALKRAALQITRTGKPVGLAIWNGRHAVVMTGFTASRDPRKGTFKLLTVTISDPYGAHHKTYSAAGSPLNKYLETDATAKYDKAWYGKYVIIVPQN